MPLFDLSAEELLTYRITTAEPEGLDQWWAQRLDKARSVAAPLTLDRHAPDAYGPTPVWDVEFSGADGDRIRAWYLRPAGVAPGSPSPWSSRSSATAAAAASRRARGPAGRRLRRTS